MFKSLTIYMRSRKSQPLSDNVVYSTLITDSMTNITIYVAIKESFRFKFRGENLNLTSFLQNVLEISKRLLQNVKKGLWNTPRGISVVDHIKFLNVIAQFRK